MVSTTIRYTQDNRTAVLETAPGKDELLLTGLTASERLNEPFTVTVDAFSVEPQPLHSLLGTDISVTFDTGGDSAIDRVFAGISWEYSGWRETDFPIPIG